MRYYYNPEVKLLLIRYSKEKVQVRYNNNPRSFDLPLIGPRPPYYANPVYTPYQPLI